MQIYLTKYMHLHTHTHTHIYIYIYIKREVERERERERERESLCVNHIAVSWTLTRWEQVKTYACTHLASRKLKESFPFKCEFVSVNWYSSMHVRIFFSGNYGCT